MGNNRYGNINELIDDIETLGDWKDVSQKKEFLKVLSKIAVIYNGYEIESENGEVIAGRYPKEVTDAIVEACKAKFPSDPEEAFDEEDNLREGYPEYSDLLFLVRDASSISYLGERSRINDIALQEFGINVYAKTATREEVDELISSSREYLEKKKKQELDEVAPTSERQEKEDNIRKSQAEKKEIEGQIAEVDEEIEELTALLNQKKAQRSDLSNSLEEK